MIEELQAPLEQSSDSKVVEIDWYGDADTVHVTPRRKERFEVEKVRAIDILDGDRVMWRQVELLMSEVAKWIREHEARLKDGFLTIQDGRLVFVAITKEASWQEDLADKLSDFDLQVARDPHLEKLEFGVVILPDAPEDSISTFLDSRFCLRFRRGEKPKHAKRSRSHRTGK